MANKGKKKVSCAKMKCTTHGFLTEGEIKNLADDGIAWMCPRHDDQRTIEHNAKMTEVK